MEQGKFMSDLIAPCGMNCGVCKAYLAYSRGVPKKRGSVTHCSGCLPRKKNCFIKRGCAKLSKNKVRFCYECEKMPCANVDRVDRRYRARYNTSLVGNLRELEENGIQGFINTQAAKFKCPTCGDVISVHDGKCYVCRHVTKQPEKR
jgi:Protein of unknown function (DUF3795)